MTEGIAGLKAGSWTLWCIGILFVIARFASRRFALGAWRKLQIDDYLMALCAVAFTGVTVSSNQVAINGSNYAPEEEIATWTPQQVADAEWGSKMLVSLEEFMLATVWLVKACLLILYARLTNGLAEAYAVKIVAVYCAVGYAVIQILYLGVWCRPIYNYWAVPIPEGHVQCKTYHDHMITVTAFHVSSDIFMLLIPVPMIARARLPLLRKVILCVIFSLGLLVVLVAILNRYYNFTTTNSLVFLIWYNGEASTAVMVANIPFCWTLLRRLFSLDAWANSSRRSRNASGAQRLTDRDRYVPPPPNRRSNHRADDHFALTATTTITVTTSPTPRRQHASLEGIDPANTSRERITAHDGGGDASLSELDFRFHDGKSSSSHGKASSDGGGGDTDIEAGVYR